MRTEIYLVAEQSGREKMRDEREGNGSSKKLRPSLLSFLNWIFVISSFFDIYLLTKKFIFDVIFYFSPHIF